VNNGNNALKGTEWEGKYLDEIIKGSFGKNAAVFNNAGQHFNHIHFWRWMKPNGGGKIPGEVEKALVESFRPPTARTRSCMAASRSSASTCGSTPTTSTIAIAGPTI
jgi:superoxide dismutase